MVKYHMHNTFLSLIQLCEGTISSEEMDKLLMTTKARRHETKAKKSRGPMLAKTRQLLTEMYGSHNQDLAGLLDSDKYLWKS